MASGRQVGHAYAWSCMSAQCQVVHPPIIRTGCFDGNP
jgi:hypothetical protein